MNKKISLFILILIIPGMLFGQGVIKNVSKVGTAAASFLEIPVGAAAVGMGGAFVSYANDASALYWNAAGIAGIKQNEIIGAHTQWIAGANFDFAGIVLNLGRLGALGLSITSLTVDDMIVRTIEKPNGTGEYFSFGDIAIGLTYAWELTDRFAIGFTGKYIQEHIWHMSARAFAVDVGTTFKTDLFNGMIIGASIYNFGTSMQLAGRDTRRFSRIDVTKMGSNERIPQNIEMDSWDLPLLLQFGISTNAYKNENYRCSIALDALHPNNDYESLNVGTEMAFQEFFFLRGGYHALFLKEAEGGLSLGAGIETNMLLSSATIKFDYAFRDMGRLENIHFIAIGVNF